MQCSIFQVTFSSSIAKSPNFARECFYQTIDRGFPLRFPTQQHELLTVHLDLRHRSQDHQPTSVSQQCQLLEQHIGSLEKLWEATEMLGTWQFQYCIICYWFGLNKNLGRNQRNSTFKNLVYSYFFPSFSTNFPIYSSFKSIDNLSLCFCSFSSLTATCSEECLAKTPLHFYEIACLDVSSPFSSSPHTSKELIPHASTARDQYCQQFVVFLFGLLMPLHFGLSIFLTFLLHLNLLHNQIQNRSCIQSYAWGWG